MEHLFENIFKNINDWLKFAEQKNVTLLVLNTGIVWGVSRIINKNFSESSLIFSGIVFGYLFNFVSIIICIASFMPVFTDKWFKMEEKRESDNILFFYDIAKYSKREFLELAKRKAGMKEYKFSEIEKDYAGQIVNNADIALSKYKQFKIASRFTIISIIFFVIFITIALLGDKL
ncbi:hypothetical protein GCAAIG_07740 [Candidatus Electronema halotolerans]